MDWQTLAAIATVAAIAGGCVWAITRHVAEAALREVEQRLVSRIELLEQRLALIAQEMQRRIGELEDADGMPTAQGRELARRLGQIEGDVGRVVGLLEGGLRARRAARGSAVGGDGGGQS